MTLEIVHCCEDALAAEASRRLLDRTVGERAQERWIREDWTDRIGSARTYVDLGGKPGWSNRADVRERRTRARRLHPRTRDGKALSGSAAWAYACARLASAGAQTESALLLLAHDTDGKDDRARDGLHAAAETGSILPTVVAAATPEFDAWILAGFSPQSTAEAQVHRDVCRELRDAGRPFDPVKEPHRLTSTIPNEIRDSKDLCARLLGLGHQAEPGDRRVQDCLDAPLEVLQANGASAGLADYLAHVVAVVLPALGAAPPQISR